MFLIIFGKFSSGNTVRCLFKAVILLHSEQASPRIYIKNTSSSRTPPPRPFVDREERKRESKFKVQNANKMRFALLSPPGRLWSPSFVMFPENTCQGTPKPAKHALMGPSSIVRRGARFRKVRCTQFREMINQI